MICEPCKTTPAPACKEVCDSRNEPKDRVPSCPCHHRECELIENPNGSVTVAPVGVRRDVR